jgi:hypothetical protein
MRVNAFKRTLEEFARQARRGSITTDSRESTALAQLAEDLSARLSDDNQRGNALRKSILSEDTISSAPAGACACCGR